MRGMDHIGTGTSTAAGDALDPRRIAPLMRGGSLDALRFFAALFMVIHHCAIESPIPLKDVHPIFERGYLITDFFLIVSGYVMGRIYGDRVAGKAIGDVQFWTRRALRLVPASLIVAAAFVAVFVGAGLLGVAPRNPQWFDWGQLPAQVLLVQSWGVPGGLGWNAPTWTLSALLVCYAVFPSLWRAVRPLRSPWVALAAGVVVMGVSTLLTQRFLGFPVWEMPLRYGVMRALPLFFLGVVLARFSAEVFIPDWLARTLCVGALAGFVGVNLAMHEDVSSLLFLSLVVVGAGAIRVTKPSKALERLAVVSFSIFITNELVRVVYFGVAHVVDDRLGLGQVLQWGVWAIGPLLAVAFAFGFHFWVDMPTQRFLKRRLLGRSAAAPRQAVAAAA